MLSHSTSLTPPVFPRLQAFAQAVPTVWGSLPPFEDFCSVFKTQPQDAFPEVLLCGPAQPRSPCSVCGPQQAETPEGLDQVCANCVASDSGFSVVKPY